MHPQCRQAACDGKIDLHELIDYINEWNSQSMRVAEVLQAIGLWKSGGHGEEN